MSIAGTPAAGGGEELDEIVRRMRGWVESVRGRLPLYARLVEIAAEQPDVHSMLLLAPRRQRLPVLLLAAVHTVVLDHPQSALGRFYPNLHDPPASGDPSSAFLELIEGHGDELRQLIATRTVQTNEVGRCALLLPAMAMVEEECGPMAMVDVGTSAGLNLGIDLYRYEYLPGPTVGDPAPVTLRCRTRGEPRLPASMPRVAARIGLDRAPVDLHDPAQVRWLQACVWPEQPERFHRLRAAISVVRQLAPPVRRGDAVDDLAATVAEVAATGHPVVTNTWVLNYLDGQQRKAYVDRLEAMAQDGDLSWIYAESPDEVGPEVPVPADASIAERTVLSLVRWRGGRRQVDHLATAHPHGRWLDWI